MNILVGENNISNPLVKNYGFIKNEDVLINIYNEVDIVLLLSIEDNLPNVILEAFACGTPIMSFSNGGMNDHVNPKTGILIKNINYQSLSSAFDQFIKNKINFNKRTIRKYAEDNFDIGLQVKAYNDLYRRILDGQ